MTDEEIRKAACEAFNADARWIGLNTAMFVERHLKCLDDVFRAGMEAGRAAEAERAMPRKRRKAAGPEPFGFMRFWSAWPAGPRKGGKAECRKIWEDHGLEASELEIFCHVQAMRMTQDWLKGGGEYVPMPATYLRQKRWDGAEMSTGPVAAPESVRAREARERVERIAPGAAARRPGAKQPQWEVIDDASQPRIGG